MLISSHLLCESLARLLRSHATLLLPVHCLTVLQFCTSSAPWLSGGQLPGFGWAGSCCRVQAGHSCSQSNTPQCCSPGLPRRRAGLAKHSFPIKGRETFQPAWSCLKGSWSDRKGVQILLWCCTHFISVTVMLLLFYVSFLLLLSLSPFLSSANIEFRRLCTPRVQVGMVLPSINSLTKILLVHGWGTREWTLLQRINQAFSIFWWHYLNQEKKFQKAKCP